MAEIETKSQVSEPTELTPEERDGLAKAISNWIDENPKEFKNIDSVRIGLVKNENIRRDSIGLLLEKSTNAQTFFEIKYNNDKIEIDHNLRDNRLGSALEGVLKDIQCNNNEKLDDAIRKYCNNINIEELNEDKGQIQDYLLNETKEKRNFASGAHVNKKTGKLVTDDECREAWKDHIVGLLIIGLVEYYKNRGINKKENEDLIKVKECLSRWYDEPNHQSFKGAPQIIKEKLLNENKEKLISEIIPIFKEKSILELLLCIISSLDEKQELVTVEGFPDMVKFSQELLFYANCSIYRNVYGGCSVENSKLETGFELLEKLCIQIGKSHNSAVTEIISGIKKISQINKDSEVFDAHFFKTLFLIGALKLCIKDAKTGVVFFTKDVNVKVKLYKSAEEANLTKEYNPYFWKISKDFLDNKNNKNRNKITNKATANCGNKSINDSITIKKNQWCIVLLYFPDKGENKMKVVKETNFPGLENLDELWQKFIKVPEIGNNNEDDDDGKITIPKKNSLQESKQAFNDYKEKIKSCLYDDFGVFIDHVNELVKAIDSLSYDENKGLDGNKTAVDTEEKKIRIELVNLRNQSFQERNQKDFEKCKEEYNKKIQKLSESNGNYYELIAKAQKEIEEQQYDDSKDFSSNEIALKNIFEELNFKLHERDAFEKEKQSLLSELEQLDCKSKKGALLKANAKEKIVALTYDEFRADKVALMNIMVQLKKDLAKIGFLDISIEKTIIITQWIDKNWKWSALALCTIVLAIVLFVVFDGDDRVRIPIDEAVPSLESKSWRISEMDSKSVFGSAEVSSVDGSNTHYSLRHITETGKEIIVTFNVDWQTGTVMSPELGEGKIEKDSKLNTIKIIFEEWTISRYY